jgi:hypothetical protein
MLYFVSQLQLLLLLLCCCTDCLEKERLMETIERQESTFKVEELESRFELEVIAFPGTAQPEELKAESTCKVET